VASTQAPTTHSPLWGRNLHPLSESLQFINEAKRCRLGWLVFSTAFEKHSLCFNDLLNFFGWKILCLFLWFLLFVWCRFVWDNFFGGFRSFFGWANEATYAMTWKICGPHFSLRLIFFYPFFRMFFQPLHSICMTSVGKVWENWGWKKGVWAYQKAKGFFSALINENFANWLV